MGDIIGAMLFDEFALDRAYWVHALMTPFKLLHTVCDNIGVILPVEKLRKFVRVFTNMHGCMLFVLIFIK